MSAIGPGVDVGVAQDDAPTNPRPPDPRGFNLGVDWLSSLASE